jgi:hypothetical protein
VRASLIRKVHGLFEKLRTDREPRLDKLAAALRFHLEPFGRNAGRAPAPGPSSSRCRPYFAEPDAIRAPTHLQVIRSARTHARTRTQSHSIDLCHKVCAREGRVCGTSLHGDYAAAHRAVNSPPFLAEQWQNESSNDCYVKRAIGQAPVGRMGSSNREERGRGRLRDSVARVRTKRANGAFTRCSSVSCTQKPKSAILICAGPTIRHKKSAPKDARVESTERLKNHGQKCRGTA